LLLSQVTKVSIVDKVKNLWFSQKNLASKTYVELSREGSGQRIHMTE